ncbi:RNA-directed DNA polymerase, eukaryota, reverse transcriptase zinc-binding domain protein [Tanacetum coccineum]
MTKNDTRGPFKKDPPYACHLLSDPLVVIGLDMRITQSLFHLHANIARFQRESKPTFTVDSHRANIRKKSFVEASRNNSVNSAPGSYVYAVKKGAHVVKIGPQSVNVKEDSPAIVLDDTCVNQTDNSTALMGKVKDFSSLTNLKVVLSNEGFDNIKLKYMGGFWVMIEFKTDISKERFKSNVGIGSWFSQLQQASNSFFVDERVTWLDIERIPLKAKYIGYVLKKLQANFKEDDEEASKSDDQGSNDGNIDENSEMHKCSNMEGESDIEEVAETTFEKEQSSGNVKEDYIGEQQITRDDYALNSQDDKAEFAVKKNSPHNSSKNDSERSKCSGHFKNSEIPRSGGSILEFLDKVIKGNFGFDYVYSPSVGSSGGILCVWDPRVFHKTNCTISDYFVTIQDEWVPKGKKIIIILVYAPRELREKKMLWDYLSLVISNWHGDVVLMGDFNEVRTKEERYGSMFNVLGANAFNSFISTAGLEEVPLGGCKFTWCHKLAAKMSKLDRFLIAEGLMNSCPNLTAITLERYLSDHRLILMRESHFDYGPIPFRFFHYWFELEGFDNFVERTWNEAHVNDTNAMTKLMKKLKYLKAKIRVRQVGFVGDGTKTKIKLAIEGDENLKYYHGVRNKQRNQLAIRCILSEGVWIESPNLVKIEFFSHFTSRFDKPLDSRLHIDIDFPNRLSFEQQTDLEINITRDEIKKAWCGWNRSCLYSSKGSVIVNGSPTNEFQFHRGLKQGDPLSPFLFLLIMESLHISVQRVVDAGSKVGCLISRVQSWNEIVNKLTSCLSKWKMKTLSIGGTLTLLKCHFFNGVEYNGKKQTWVKRNKVLASKDNGGLGVSSFFALNRALLFKWVWRFHTQQSSLWSKVIKGIHGKDGKLGRQVKNMQPSVWLDIVRERGENNLKTIYPRMYSLEIDKYVTVANKMSHGDMSFSFRIVSRGGLEEFQFTQLLKDMEDVSLIDMKDRWSWSLEGFGDFSVASVRKMLDDRNLPVVSSKTRWINVVPIKVNILAWKIRLDSLPTRLNISKRGMDIDSILCSICDKVESTSHIIFTCHIAREICRKISCWWDVNVLKVSSYEEWLEWLSNS